MENFNIRRFPAGQWETLILRGSLRTASFHQRRQIWIAIPLSSPKNTDYQIINGERRIRKSIIPIIRITAVSSNGEPELKGTLKLSNMIPVPASELTLYDIDNESDRRYKALIHKELIFIRKNQKKIKQNAKLLYKQKSENNSSIGYLKSTVDFRLLEQKHDEFIRR